MIDSEWVNNINVNEMIYIASFEDDIGEDYHVLAFYYKGYLINVQNNASMIVVWKNIKGAEFKSVYDYNYFNYSPEKPSLKKFEHQYEKMIYGLTFIFYTKIQIIEEFKILKRKMVISEICE